MFNKAENRGNRSNLFQTRQRQERVFQKKPFGGMVPNEAIAPVKVDRETVMRRQALRRLVADAKGGVERIAMICELSDERVNRLQDGKDVIDSHFAMHMEEMLRLPPGWMEKDEPIPKETLQMIQADKWTPPSEDDVIFGESADQDSIEESTQESNWVDEAFGAGDTSSDHSAAASASAGAAEQGVQKSASDKVEAPYLDSQIKLMQVADIFPAVRQYLHEKTGKSLPTISGIMTGKRPLTQKNAEQFEQALGLPVGWLSRPGSEEEMTRDLRQSVGAAMDAPRPKRGRKPGVSMKKSAPTPVTAQPSAPAQQPERASANPVHTETVAAKPFTRQVQSAQAQVAQAQPAQQLRAEAASRALPDTQDILMAAVLDKIQELRQKGQVSDQKMSRILNVLFD